MPKSNHDPTTAISAQSLSSSSFKFVGNSNRCKIGRVGAIHHGTGIGRNAH